MLVDSILPALAGLDPHLPPPARLAQAVERNVRWTLRTVIESPEGRARVAEGRVKYVGAIYEIQTGRVRFLEPTETASHTPRPRRVRSQGRALRGPTPAKKAE